MKPPDRALRRHPMMKRTIAAVTAFLAFAAASASAQVIGIEEFNYPNGAIANQNGGTFWNYRNRVPAAYTNGVSDWDNVDNFSGAVVMDGRLVTNNSSARREYNGPGEGTGGNIETDEGYGAINN